MKIIHFYHFDSDPRCPPFLLYVRWKSGVTFVRRCFRDDVDEINDEEHVEPYYGGCSYRGGGVLVKRSIESDRKDYGDEI